VEISVFDFEKHFQITTLCRRTWKKRIVANVKRDETLSGSSPFSSTKPKTSNEG
jgi:hypothetical protein